MFRPHNGNSQGQLFREILNFMQFCNSGWPRMPLMWPKHVAIKYYDKINYKVHKFSFAVPSSSNWEGCLLHRTIGSPETSAINYHYSLHNGPEECSSHLLRGGSQTSRLKEAEILKISRNSNYLTAYCNIKLSMFNNLSGGFFWPM
jgi:hypothetical protein